MRSRNTRSSHTPLFGLLLTALLLGAAWGSVLLGSSLSLATEDENDLRRAASRKMEDGNPADAYAIYRELALDGDTDRTQVGNDLRMALQCLQQLARWSEIDDLLENVIDVHDENWLLLWAAAQQYRSIPHYGYIVAGEFERGNRRAGGRGGEYASSQERDRVRMLQLMALARTKRAGDTVVSDRQAATFDLDFAAMILAAGQRPAWRLQELTDLDLLPDYDKGYRGYGWNSAGSGAPVDAAGDPVYHRLPDSFENAASDGERWRFLLASAARTDEHFVNQVRMTFADFLHSQFGVQTLQWFSLARNGDDPDTNGPFALPSLEETETIAKLATGTRRFTLPDEFNFIKIYRAVAADDRNDYAEDALGRLGALFENRMQYPKALALWKESLERFGGSRSGRTVKRERISQIEGNWGRFEQAGTQAARTGASVDYRFRNGNSVRFEAQRIDMDRLLDDVTSYLRKNPGRIDRQKIGIENIGWRIVQQNERRYLGKKVADWSMDLQPFPAHFDRRITVATPLTEAGAYLLTARMDDGNTSRIVLWIADTTIVRKTMSEEELFYVCDAISGEPIARANVELFGYRQRRIDKKRYTTDIRNFAEISDRDGQVRVSGDDESRQFQWLIRATTDDGRRAFLGFSRIAPGKYHDHGLDQNKLFTITDRPVYRPGDSVQFKHWVARTRYDEGDSPSPHAGDSFTVKIQNPQGEDVFETLCRADDWGGFDGEFSLADDATLGVYSIQVPGYGASTFRVEEYKKPEFEVTVEAPTRPVQLGETVTATIRARYYFGAPVTDARVTYKVYRTASDQPWHPAGRWDWLYGRGYGWFAYDAPWYPGFHAWGCLRPVGWWHGWNPAPPELVAEREAEIGEDGTVQVEIDTSVAQALYGDSDHRYKISAEVVDRSRRTIVGNGSVTVTRKPFRVNVWVDRGHYRVGDTIGVTGKAHTIDGKPVSGEAVLRLLSIRYDDDDNPVETEIERIDTTTDADGSASMQLTAARQGQYRISLSVTDADGRTVEGGYMVLVIGEGFDGSGFRFNAIEIIPDKAEYAPGERARFVINTDRPGSTVLLFVRPVRGIVLPPEVLRLSGKSTVFELDITRSDMPNFFIEALTVADARVHRTMREIVVPPESRVFDIAVEPDAESYLPGQHADIALRLTDADGEPVVGTTVVAIYDQALEYISGGSNVPDIREHFWKWRRTHNPREWSNLGRRSGNLVDKDKQAMLDIGAFGNRVLPSSASGWEMESRGARSLGEKKMRANSPMDGLSADFEAAGATESLERLGYLGDEAQDDGDGGAPADAALADATVRKEFADTALWVASVTADRDGRVEVSLDMPENLTTWKIRAWAMGDSARVGSGSASVVTTKNVVLRMQAPRFFVEKDEVVLSANIHNYLEEETEVVARLELDGGCLEAMGDMARSVTIPASGEVRVDWRVRALREGDAVVRMLALTDTESDAMEMTFPVQVHGMLRTESWSRVIRPDEDSGRIEITVPAERRPEQSRLELRFSPTLAGAMVDALPYLAGYPYGCTEQTLNRFLPSVITQKILLDMNLDLAAIRDKRTNLNAQEIGDDSERAAQWRRLASRDPEREPVFDEAELLAMVKQGVADLTAMQNDDGGWGWFSGYGERSWAHTTAVVVHGLQIAAQNDIGIVPGVIDRGLAWLRRHQKEQVRRLENAATEKRPYKKRADALDALVFTVLVDAGDRDLATMRDFLFRDRTFIGVYGKSMLGIALHTLGDNDMLAMVLQNIEQFLEEDDENQTAWLRVGASWWSWYDSEIEANSWYLKLLTRVDPTGARASRVVKYLLNNRRHGTYWSSTRDTAYAIEALADYLRASGESEPDMTVEIVVDGEVRKQVAIDSSNLFSFDNRFVLAGDALESGDHTIELRRRGTGPVYANAYLTNFTLEDPIRKAGLEIRVERSYYRLVPVERTAAVEGAHGQATRTRVEAYRREEIVNAAEIESGDLIEIEMVIDSKNDYEYIAFEDRKAAGLEPVDVRSGYDGNSLGAYVEYRDDRVGFFCRQLPRGRHSIAYRVRAEIPGSFSALPTIAQAMYAPELRANSNEHKLRIRDRDDG